MLVPFLLSLGLAHGARDIQVCGQWTPDIREASLLDSDGADANGDGDPSNDRQDRLVTNDPLRAHGLLAVLDYRTGGTFSPWTQAWSGFLTVGPGGGCTPVTSIPASSGVQTRLKFYSVSQAPGHDPMPVWDDDVSPSVGCHIGPTTFHPLGTTTKTVDLGAGDSKVDIAIVLAYALNRESGGVTGMDYDVYNTSPSGGSGGGGMNYFQKKLWVDTGVNLRRILHELGHALHAERSNHWVRDVSWRNAEYTDTLCPATQLDGTSSDGSTSHYTDSDEAHSGSIIEGFATYYAAQTLNRTDEADCFVAHRAYDWNHNGSTDSTEGQEWYSCDIAPVPDVGLSEEDYFGDVCGSPGGLPAGEVYGLSTQLDWTRMFWDLDVAYPWTTLDMFEIVAGADPLTWIETPTFDTTATGYDPDDRAHIRMYDSAVARSAIVSTPSDELWFDYLLEALVHGVHQ